MSTRRLKDLQPDDVLKPEHLEEYKERREVAGQRLLNLRTALFILRRIDDFPFDLLGAPPPHNFWSAVQSALLESCVLRVWLLTKEVQGYRPAHLLELRDFVRRGIRDEFRDELEAHLAEVSFEAAVAGTLERVKGLRHKVVAHVDRKHEEALQRNQLQSLKELEEVASALRKLFDILCFGFEAATLPLDYLTNEDGLRSKPKPTDIDELLLLVGGASPLLEEPQRNHEMWEIRKAELTEAELRTLNEWRKKTGVPKAS